MSHLHLRAGGEGGGGGRGGQLEKSESRERDSWRRMNHLCLEGGGGGGGCSWRRVSHLCFGGGGGSLWIAPGCHKVWGQTHKVIVRLIS